MHWPSAAIWLVAIALAARGIDYLLWSVEREKARFHKIVAGDLSKIVYTNGFATVLFGGLLAYAARNLPNTVLWQILGGLVVVLGCIFIVMAVLAKPASPATQDMPADAVLAKRVLQKRISGALFLFGAFVWLASAKGWLETPTGS